MHMAKEVCLRRLVNFFNAIGVLGEDNANAAPSTDALTNMNKSFSTKKPALKLYTPQKSGRENQGFTTLNYNTTELIKNNSDSTIYSLSSLKLEKLKALILDQARELKIQKNTIDQQLMEVNVLRAENETVVFFIPYSTIPVF